MSRARPTGVAEIVTQFGDTGLRVECVRTRGKHEQMSEYYLADRKLKNAPQRESRTGRSSTVATEGQNVKVTLLGDFMFPIERITGLRSLQQHSGQDHARSWRRARRSGAGAEFTAGRPPDCCATRSRAPCPRRRLHAPEPSRYRRSNQAMRVAHSLRPIRPQGNGQHQRQRHVRRIAPARTGAIPVEAGRSRNCRQYHGQQAVPLPAAGARPRARRAVPGSSRKTTPGQQQSAARSRLSSPSRFQGERPMGAWIDPCLRRCHLKQAVARP